MPFAFLAGIPVENNNDFRSENNGDLSETTNEEKRRFLIVRTDEPNDQNDENDEKFDETLFDSNCIATTGSSLVLFYELLSNLNFIFVCFLKFALEFNPFWCEKLIENALNDSTT